MLAVTLPFTMIFLFFATPILALFGGEFTQFSETFFVLVLLQSLNVLTGPAGNLLMMADQQKMFRNLVIVGLVLVLALSWVLIPKYNALGAALAVFLGYGFVNLSSFLAALRILKKVKAA
jgi:O-antigen/teichoic acid export membrane protein